MRFDNIRGVFRHADGLGSLVRLGLATGISSHHGLAPIARPLLTALAHNGRLRVRYRQHGKRLTSFLRLADLASDLQGFLEVVVRDCYQVPSTFQPASVIDGGANCGLFTLASLARWPGTAAVAVEPLPDNASLIEECLHLNGFRAHVVRACLGKERGEAAFYCRAANRGSMRDDHTPFQGSITVPVVSLIEIRGTLPAGTCLIKLDVEGAETDVLDSYLPHARGDELVVGELHGWPEHSKRFEAVLSSHGFEVVYHSRDPRCVLFRAAPARFRRDATEHEGRRDAGSCVVH